MHDVDLSHAVSVGRVRNVSVPILAWAQIALWLLLFGSALSGGLEMFWRARGFRPDVVNSKDLWHFWRERVYHPGGKVVVFLGTSRIQSDISLETVRKSLPGYRVIQLGLSGGESCIGLLEELAADTRFIGLVVCDLDTPLLQKPLWDARLDFRDYCPSLVPYSIGVARAFLEDKTVLLQGPLSIRSVVGRTLRTGSLPKGRFVSISFQREMQWRFTGDGDRNELERQTTREYELEYREHLFPQWESLAADVSSVGAIVQRLKKRGGNVVFLRLPSSGTRWQLEEQYHSKAANWDRFAAAINADCIHFKDYPSMRDLTCADGSHLDCYQSVAFTRTLIDALTSRGGFRR